MARINGPIQVWSRNDTTPTDAQGGYAGGDSTAAAVGTSLDQSSRALGAVDNLVVTAQTLDYGQEATATISGVSPWKTIDIGIPKGMPDTVGAQLTADAAASADAAALARDDANAAVLLAQQAQAASLEVPDDNVSALIGNDVTLTAQAGDARWAPRVEITERDKQPVNVANFGFSNASVTAALDEATARGRGTVAYFPAGVYDVGNGLDLTGRHCQIRGDGAYTQDGATSPHRGTIFHATTQAAPVLDFSGWLDPWNFQGKVTHEGFMVRGSGVADPTKNNAGIRLKAIGSTTFRDIAIIDTGGPCIEGVENAGDGVYLSDFERIILNAPVGAAANDVPWMTFNEANCCNFTRIGLRALGTAANVGVSGAVVIDTPPSFSSALSRFDAFWFENLRVVTGGTLVRVRGRKHVFTDPQFIDCFKDGDAATGTSHFRFEDAPGITQGGNEVRGVIPGRDPDYTDAIDFGVDMLQSYNRVVGVKGRDGYNVRLASGVNAHVDLGGAAFAADRAAVVQDGVASISTLVIDGGGGGNRTMSGWEKISANSFVVPLSNLSNVAYTAGTSNGIIVCTNLGQTITLPNITTVERGRQWTVKATEWSVTVSGGGVDIDTAPTDSLPAWGVGRYVSNGSQWVKV